MTTPNTDSVRPLIEGYHAVFDLKDAQTPGSDLFIQAADVARGIADLIEAAGGNASQRYDRQGRQVALSAPDYAPLYDEAVESLGRAMAAVPHPKRALLRDSGLVLRELRALAMQAQVAAELDAEDEQIDRSEGK